MRFGAGNVASEALRLGWQNFPKVAMYIILFAVLSGCFSLLYATASGMALPRSVNGVNTVLISSFDLTFSLINILIGFIASVAACVVISEDALGHPIGFGEGLRRGIARTPIAFVLSLLISILFILVNTIPLFVSSFAAGVIGPEAMTILVVVLMLPLYIWFAVTFLPLLPTVVIEEDGFRSLTRCFEMTQGHRLGILGSYLIALFFGFFIALFSIGGLSVVVSGAMSGPPLLIVPTFVFASVVGFCIYALFLSTVIGFQAAVYARLQELES